MGRLLLGIAVVAGWGFLPCAGAEIGFGEIGGRIFEVTGEPAGSAKLTLVDLPTGARREFTADALGNYVFDAAAGSYRLVARSAGRIVSVDVVVAEGQKVELSLVLSQMWAEWRPGAPEVDPQRLNSNGQRNQNNDLRLDGVDNNEVWLRGAIVQPPLESIETARLNSTYLPAESGNALGAAVNVRTRSGQDQFHGSAYELLQNSALNARNFFDGPQIPHLSRNQFGASFGGPIRRRDWFFFLNGELLRERRGLTVVSTVPSSSQRAGDFTGTPGTLIYDPLTTVVAASGAVDRQLFPNNRIPLTRISLPSQRLVALYPAANLPGAANNFLFAPAESRNSQMFDARSDKTFSTRHALFVRLNYGWQHGQSPSALPGLAASDPTQNATAARSGLIHWGGAVGHTFVFRPTLINEVRAGTARFDFNSAALDAGLNAASALGIPGLGSQGLPAVQPLGLAQLGAAGPVPLQIATTSYHLQDNVTWTTGRHRFKFGAQGVRRHADGNAGEWNSRGTFFFTPDYTNLPGVLGTGDSLASLLLGDPTEFRRDTQAAPFRLRGWEWHAFAQDEIRIGHRFSVQAGVHYSLNPPPTEADNRLANFNYEQTNPAVDIFAGQNGVNQYGRRFYNKRALAPSIGFAWDAFGNGSTLVRGAFSLTYDTGAYLWLGSLARNAPFASRQDVFNGSFLPGMNLATGVAPPDFTPVTSPAALNRAAGAIYAVEGDGYTPNTHQFGLMVEQRLRSRLTLQLSGTGSMAMHLYEARDLNQPVPGPTTLAARRTYWSLPNTRIDYLDFAGGSTYYGGRAALRGELARVHLFAAYTFGKSVDDATAPGTDLQSRPATAQNSFDLRGARSPSVFDIAHQVAITAAYDLRFRNAFFANWKASTMVSAQTGFPFTPQLAANGLNNGGFQLPNRLANAPSSGALSYLHWFNTAAFVSPGLYQFGDSGFGVLRGPGMASVDASLARSFRVREKLHLQARVEAFNLLNRTNFGLPNRILGVASTGVINHTSTNARQLQVSIRTDW